MSAIKNLINAIAKDDTVASLEQFEQIMKDKVTQAIEAKRQEVGQTLFGESTTKKSQKIDESELVLEDYSIEELQEFIESEDYEQLDELSKKTLGSYINAATKDKNNRQDKAKELGDTESKLRDVDYSPLHHIKDKNIQSTLKTSVSNARSDLINQKYEHERKIGDRKYGIHTALKKLVKESEAV